MNFADYLKHLKVRKNNVYQNANIQLTNFISVPANIMKIVTNHSNGNEMRSELTLSQEASQYKNIIREQDSKIQTLSEQLRQFQATNANLTVSYDYEKSNFFQKIISVFF